MNACDIGAIVFAIIFAVSFYRLGLAVTLNSFFSFLLAIFLSSFFLNPLLNFLLALGWRENVFTPFIVYCLLVILIWGGMLTVLSYIVPFKGRSLIARIISIPVSLVYAILIWVFIWDVIPQFIGSKSLFEVINNSVIRNKVNNFSIVSFIHKQYLVKLQPKLARSVILSKPDNRAVILDFDFKKVVYSKDETDELYDLISDEREKVGAEKLERRAELDKLAYDSAMQIVSSKYFSHLDQSGRLPRDRAQSAGIDFQYIGENLALAPTIEQAHEGLIKSSIHRENIDSKVFRRIGLCVIDLGLNGKLVVEEFTN